MSTIFVENFYQGILRRPVDDAGLAYWTGVIGDESVSREEAITAVVGSAEAQSFVVPVFLLYNNIFERDPESAALTFWADTLRAGVSVTELVADVADEPEFLAEYGDTTNTQFVTQLYLDVLERAGDSEGIAAWTGQLDAGALSRADVIVSFLTSAENLANDAVQVNTKLVYLGTLGRLPDAAELASGITQTLPSLADALIPGGTITGTIADDQLLGSTGDDTILGDIGNDNLIGAAGDDVLDGGNGDDRLVGDSGADTYLYRFNGTGTGQIPGDDGADTLVVDSSDTLRLIDTSGTLTTLAELQAAEDAGRFDATSSGGTVTIDFGAPSPITLPPGRDELDSSGAGQILLLGVPNASSVTSITTLAAQITVEIA